MEHYSVNFANRACGDLRDAARYVAAQFSAPAAASRRVKNIKKTIGKRLSSAPRKSGPVAVCDNPLASMGIRVISVENRTVFFVVDESEKVVNVLRIIQSRRDWARVFSDFI